MKLSESIQMEVVSNQTKPYHINQTKPYQTNSKLSLKQPKPVRSWWNFHRTFWWMLSQTRPNHSKPYHTKPYHIKPNQTNFKSSLKQPKQVRSSWNFQRAFRWRLSQTKPYHINQTKPYHTIPYQTPPQAIQKKSGPKPTPSNSQLGLTNYLSIKFCNYSSSCSSSSCMKQFEFFFVTSLD